MSKPSSYSRTQIGLHWLIAALVIYQILFHEVIEGLWDQRMSGVIANVATPTGHTIVGLVIFVLAAWRLGLRLSRGAPALPEDEHPALKFVASATHILFYVLLIGMPVSGALAWFLGLAQPAAGHSLAGKVLIALVLLHVAAALAQHFWYRTDVLKRMLGMTPADAR